MNSSVLSVVGKPSVSDEIKSECANILRRALALAEAGDLTAVLVIVKHAGDTWSDERSGAMNFPDAVGRLEIVKQAWINSYLRELK